MCGCIQLGNRIYDVRRDSLLLRYLSDQEAASDMETCCDISVKINLPVHLKDQQDRSIYHRWPNLGSGGFHESFFAVPIRNEQTSLFHVSCGTVMYIDSHSHGSSSTMVVTGKLQDLEIMWQCVWNLEENDISTSGFCQIQDMIYFYRCIF